MGKLAGPGEDRHAFVIERHPQSNWLRSLTATKPACYSRLRDRRERKKPCKSSTPTAMSTTALAWTKSRDTCRRETAPRCFRRSIIFISITSRAAINARAPAMSGRKSGSIFWMKRKSTGPRFTRRRAWRLAGSSPRIGRSPHAARITIGSTKNSPK